MKATLKFTSREHAKAFTISWGRFSLRGHDISPPGADGATSVTVHNVSAEEKQWLDAYIQTASPTELHEKLSALLEDPARDLYAETIFTLTADLLATIATQDHWKTHPGRPVEDWQAEVAAGDTRLGYHEWCAASA